MTSLRHAFSGIPRGIPTSHEICLILICEDLRNLWFIFGHPHSRYRCRYRYRSPPGELEWTVIVTSVENHHYRSGNFGKPRCLFESTAEKSINKSNICTNNSFIYINISFILTNISLIYSFHRGVFKFRAQ